MIPEPGSCNRFFTPLAPWLSPQRDCRVEGHRLAVTGSLLTSGTSLWCLVLPSRSPSGLLVLLPFHSMSALPGRQPYLSSAASHNPVTSLSCPHPMTGSSGFSPPHCYQASQALSPQYYPQICHPLPLSQSGSLPSRVRFMTPPRIFGVRTGGFPRVRPHRLPISRPTSPRFGSPDIRTRSRTSARPPPRSHLVGSLFATYMGSASCFLQTPISGYALALLALPFRPVTAGYYFFGECVMPGARELPRSKLRGI